MTEKQRWLLAELDAWRKREQERLGHYGPKATPPVPRHVKEAQRAKARAEKVLRRWEQQKKAPWTQQMARVTGRYQIVRRIILFEKTEVALTAIRTLTKEKEHATRR